MTGAVAANKVLRRPPNAGYLVGAHRARTGGKQRGQVAVMSQHEEILVSLRRIIRAADLNSKRLAKEIGLTAPQLLLLQAIDRMPDATIGALAKDVNLTQATVTAIIDRMESRRLVRRKRNAADKRKVNVLITPAGRKILVKAPTILQDRFIEWFRELEEWEQTYIIGALQRVAHMLDAEDIDASPVLDVGAIDRPVDLDQAAKS